MAARSALYNPHLLALLGALGAANSGELLGPWRLAWFSHDRLPLHDTR
jgi:hypothetical protein